MTSLKLHLDPSTMTTAQQKGERIVGGRFIQHYIKPAVIQTITQIDNAIGAALIRQGLPTKTATIKLNGKLVKRVVFDSPYPRTSPLGVTLSFNFPSRSSDRKAVRERYSWHTERPDLDNLAKGMLDRLTALNFFADDSQIVALNLEKHRTFEGAEPYILVTIGELTDDNLPEKGDYRVA